MGWLVVWVSFFCFSCSDAFFKTSNFFLQPLSQTTGNCLAYTAFLLATHPEIQAKVLEEIDRILPDRTTLKYEDVPKFKYLEQCIQESLRLYPPAPRGTRYFL